MSDDRRVLVEMPKPAVTQAACTKLLVDFFYCVPNTKLHIEILTWHTLNFNPRSATALRNPTPPDNRTSTVLVILFANNGLGLTDGTVLALD